MEEARSKRWRGVLANERPVIRRLIAVIFSLLVISMVAAQLSFFPIGNTHVIMLLAPIALASLLLGKWQGLFVGTIACAADDPRPLRVHLTWRSDPNTVVIEIGDDGVPFNQLEREDPVAPGSIEEAKIGGLGLLMTKKLMDDIEYVREGIANVTIITKSWE